MRIIWSAKFKQFEVQLSSGECWSSDQQIVKSVGFKCEGPPEWRWVAFRAAVLTKLKTVKPMSGLTITPEALENYNRLQAQETANALVKKALKDAKKAQKKEKADTNEEQGTGTSFKYDTDGWAIVEPGESKIWNKFIPPAQPSTLCSVCRTPVYWYESQEPPLCLDCEFLEDF
jgi:hypothetical protein